MYMFAMANDRRREGEIRELVVIDGWDKTMAGDCNVGGRESEKEFGMLRINQRKRHTCDRSREKESEARDGSLVRPVDGALARANETSCKTRGKVSQRRKET